MTKKTATSSRQAAPAVETLRAVQADLAMLATGPAVAMPGTWCAHVGHWQGTGQRPGVDVSHRLATSTSAAGRRLAR